MVRHCRSAFARQLCFSPSLCVGSFGVGRLLMAARASGRCTAVRGLPEMAFYRLGTMKSGAWLGATIGKTLTVTTPTSIDLRDAASVHDSVPGWIGRRLNSAAPHRGCIRVGLTIE